MTRILTYNINGIRSAVKKGLIEWLEEVDADIVCFQETKARSSAIPVLLFESLGYQHYWHSAERKGYSGVATLSKNEPKRVFRGLGIERFDIEGRVIRTDFPDWTLFNCYFPNGGSGPARHAYKMDFLEEFYYWIEQFREEHPNVIVVGDYNIAHQKMDIHDPVRNHSSSGFRPEERDWMTKWLANGFVDSFRHLNPEMVSYTWWRQTQYAREVNKGWRLDYQTVSDTLQDKIQNVAHLQDAFHSDHCPVLLEIDVTL